MNKYSQFKSILNSKPGPISNTELAIIESQLRGYSTDQLLKRLESIGDLTKSDKAEREIIAGIIASRDNVEVKSWWYRR